MPQFLVPLYEFNSRMIFTSTVYGVYVYCLHVVFENGVMLVNCVYHDEMALY